MADEAFNLDSISCSPSVTTGCSDVVCTVATPVFTSGLGLVPFVQRLDGRNVDAGTVDNAVITNRFNPEGNVDSEFLFLYKTPCDEVRLSLF